VLTWICREDGAAATPHVLSLPCAVATMFLHCHWYGYPSFFYPRYCYPLPNSILRAESISCTAPQQILTPEDVKNLLPCTNITGVLNISSSYPGTFSLPTLAIGEAIYVSSSYPSYLTAISLPNLISLSGTLDISSDTLEILNVSSIMAVKETYLNTPSLHTWSGAWGIQDSGIMVISSHNITDLRFNNLARIGDLNVTFASPNSSLFVNGSMNGLSILVSGFEDTTFESGFPNHGSLGFSGVSSIKLASAWCLALFIYNNPSLTQVDIPLLSIGPPNSYPFIQASMQHVMDVKDAIFIANNDKLTSVTFNNLELVGGGIQIMGNKLLNVIGASRAIPTPNLAFGMLEEVRGSILLSGDFKSYGSSLNYARGTC
jgi:hypothetical protein